MQGNKIKKKIDIKDLIFYIVLIAIPFVNFCIFYVGVGFNSILLTFRTYKYQGAKLVEGWTAFGNIRTAIDLFLTDYTHLMALKNSLGYWLIGYTISMALALLFSYYISKKMIGAGLFRIMLFLPSIISAMSLVVIYKYFVDRAIPEVVNLLFKVKPEGLLENESTQFASIVVFNILMGFGTWTLMFSNAMSGIEPEVIEAAKIDGAAGIKEFVFVIFPMIYSTFVTFTIISVGGIFINQANLFSFFSHGASANTITVGYYFYEKTLAAGSNLAEYPLLAAMGIVLTFISIPITYLVKWALEKYGPQM